MTHSAENVHPTAFARGRAAGRFAVGTLTFLITPFVVTGAFRLFDAVPTSLPFLVALVIAAWLWRVHRGLRPVAAGMAAATVTHAAFLAWLFLTWDWGGLAG